MSAAESVVRASALFVPRALRDRYRDEWLANLAHCDELSISPNQVAWAAVRTSLASQGSRFSTRDVSPGRLARRGVIAVVVALALLIVGVLFRFSTTEFVLWFVAAVVGTAGLVSLVRAAARVVGPTRLPNALLATSITALLALVTGIVEANVHFAVVDAGNVDAPLDTVMVGTGMLGVAAFIAAIVLAIVLAVRVVRSAGRSRQANIHP
jgi:hypothetical protein